MFILHACLCAVCRPGSACWGPRVGVGSPGLELQTVWASCECRVFPAHTSLFLKTSPDIEDRMVGSLSRERDFSEWIFSFFSFSMWLEAVKAFKSTSYPRRGGEAGRWEQRWRWNWKLIYFFAQSRLCSVVQEIVMCEAEFCFEEGIWSPPIRFI